MTALVDWPCPEALPAQAAAWTAAAAAAADAGGPADAVRGPWETAWQVGQHALGWHAAAGSPSFGDPGEQHQLVNLPASLAAAAAAAVHAAVSAEAIGAAEQAVRGAAGIAPAMVTYADYVGVGWGLDPMMGCEHACSCLVSHEREVMAQ